MLRRSLATLLVVVLVAPGCAPRWRPSTGPAPVHTERPEAEQPGVRLPDTWRRVARQLPAAARVRIELADGTRMTGVILSVEDEALVVKRKTRIPEPERRVTYDTIEMLELDSGGGIGAGKAAAIGIGTGAAAFLGLLLITFALVSD